MSFLDLTIVQASKDAATESATSKILIQLFGAFCGAFFAYVFFVIGEKYKVKRKWEITVKREHAYLERYLDELFLSLRENRRTLEIIIDCYNKKTLNLLALSDLPLRHNSSMRIKDILFINRIETYTTIGLKKINRWQKGLHLLQNKINEGIESGDDVKIKRATSSIAHYIQDASELLKSYDYYIDAVHDLKIENRVLLKRNKQWKYDKKLFEQEYQARKEQIQKEKDNAKSDTESCIYVEVIDRMKKFGISNIDNDLPGDVKK